MSASNQVGAFNYAVPPFTKLQIKNITAAYTVVAGDLATVINCSGATSFTVSLTAAATLGAGFNVTVWNNTTTAAMAVTIDPSGSETIDGQSTLILRRGEGMQIVCDGTNWQTGNKKMMRAYSENYSATAVIRSSATGNASLAIGAQAVASGNGSLALGGFSSGPSAGGVYAIAIGEAVSAAPNYSTAIGNNSAAGVGSVTATGAGAMALGGSYASGTDSFAAAIANNTSTYGAQGANSVAIGNQAKSTATGSVAISANRFANAQATANGAVAIGDGALASGSLSTAIGRSVTASSGNSVAIGTSALADVIGKYAFSNSSFASSGDSQTGTFILRRATTDATATVLTTDNAAASSTNQVILANNQAMTVTGTVICRQSVAGSDKASGWTFTAVIRRGANAASTALVAAVTPILVAQDLSLATTVLAITADTTNGGLAVTVTGIAATNIRWVATIQTSECTYA